MYMLMCWGRVDGANLKRYLIQFSTNLKPFDPSYSSTIDLIYHGTSSDDSARKKAVVFAMYLSSYLATDLSSAISLLRIQTYHVGLKVFMELHGRVLGQDPSSRSTDPKKGWLEPSFLLCDTKTLSF